MHTTPTLSMQFCRVIVRLIDDFEKETGYSDSSLSRSIFSHAEGIKPLREWNGSNRSPTLNKIAPIEAFIRSNFAEDPAEAERLYQASLARATAAEEYQAGAFSS